MKIISYGNKETEQFDLSGVVFYRCKWHAVAPIARRKLDMLRCSNNINDLRVPPGNQLELLKGNLKNYYSIRINGQWRIIFQIGLDFTLSKVQIIDYH